MYCESGFNSPPSNLLHQINPFLGIAEPFSCLSHLGLALIVALKGKKLFSKAQDKASRIGINLYLFGALFSMIVSSIYHLVEPCTSRRYFLRKLDHSAIFFLIAGTFSGCHLTCFKKFSAKYFPPLLLWTLAVIGVTLKVFFFDHINPILSHSLYLLCGWIGLLTAFQLYQKFGLRLARPALLYLLLGGIFYSGGALIDCFRRDVVLVSGVIGAHEVFHVGVFLGVMFHFYFETYCAEKLHPLIALEDEEEERSGVSKVKRV
ncbi:hypothetical protein GEMRC1_012354 [Eukaryota sp. GEM-RC1]